MNQTMLSERINELFASADWPAARKLIEKERQKTPQSHWLLARLATTYYEQGEYERALEWARAAREMAPHCPLVLWELAGALQMTGDHKETIRTYAALIKRGVQSVAEDECGEGWEWAASLLTDSLFRAGVSLQHLGEKQLASRMFHDYLTLREWGNGSLYSAEDAIKRIVSLNPANSLDQTTTLKKASKELALADD